MKIEKNELHTCNICGLKLKHKCNMKAHLNTHERKTSFPCDICGKVLTRSTTLKRHEETYHQSAKTPKTEKPINYDVAS